MIPSEGGESPDDDNRSLDARHGARPNSAPTSPASQSAATPAAPSGAPTNTSTAAALIGAAGIVILAGATVGLRLEVRPFIGWYYHFAWLGTLLAADGLVAWLRRDRPFAQAFPLLGDRRRLADMLFWSTVVWLFYELLNLRLADWYYVSLPGNDALRWIGTAVAFTTVLPAVRVAEALLDTLGIGRSARSPRWPVTPRLLVMMPWIGALLLGLQLLWPRYFFPLIWVVLAPLLEPALYRRDKQGSLLADLERGQPGRLLRLLLGGAAIGFVWELLNIGARSKWIYTVPWFEEAPRLFEMPVLGFLGFPPFAVCCFIAWRFVRAVERGPGLSGAAAREGMDAATAAREGSPGQRAADRDGGTAHVGDAARLTDAARAGQSARGRGRAWMRIGALRIPAVVASFLVLLAMDGRTVVSTVPMLDRLEVAAAAQLDEAGYDVFRVARSQPQELVADAGLSPEDADLVVAAARMATLRGMGADYANAFAAAGLDDLSDLAASSPDELIEAAAAAGLPLPRARAWVWAAAARREVAERRARAEN